MAELALRKTLRSQVSSTNTPIRLEANVPAAPRGRIPALLLLMLSALPAAPNSAKRTAGSAEQWVPQYHSTIPLGVLAYELKPLKRSFYIAASAMGTEFAGWKVLGPEYHHYLVDSSGATVSSYPGRLVFRVSAGARDKSLIGGYRQPVLSASAMNDFLLGLRFRLKIFHGLKMHVQEPAALREIGMPAYVSYDERVYHVAFDLKDVPINDRIVLEVLDPGGERIGKFHFDLY
jgi:hypothetical protein